MFVNPTPFDVRLVAFGIPIRVHPSFWIVMALLGWDAERPEFTFLWVVCGFFSVLIHEFGHALTAELFGWPTQIVLYFAGGLAISERRRNNTAWRSVVVSLMGPVAGLLFWVLVELTRYMLNLNRIGMNETRFYIIGVLIFMNLAWSLLNLIPVLPLDGGHICLSLCEILRLRDPVKVTLTLGGIVSGMAAYYFFNYAHQQFAGMLMIMLCIQSVMGLQSRR